MSEPTRFDERGTPTECEHVACNGACKVCGTWLGYGWKPPTDDELATVDNLTLAERTKTLFRERDAAKKAMSDLGEMIGHLVWMLETNNAPGWEGDCPVCIQAKGFIREGTHGG